jgi:hypothetical protein
MVFSSILQNDEPKPKKFWVKWGTKHTLSIIGKIFESSFLINLFRAKTQKILDEMGN